MHERQGRAHGAVLKPALDAAIEPDLHVILDGDGAALGGAGTLRHPTGNGDGLHVEFPLDTLGKVLLEGVEVPGVRVQVAGISGDKGGVRVFAGVIEDPHGPGEPAKVCLVTHDHGVVAALCHEGTQTDDAAGGTVHNFRHGKSFQSTG